MKKILLGATALTLVGMAGAASAQNVTTSPFNLDIGGAATLGIGYVDTEATSEGTGDSPNDGQPVQIINNAEIHFVFELVADNGLTFGYDAEFEMNNGGDRVDEFHGFVKGSFGEVQIGNQDGAADAFTGYYANTTFTNAADGAGFLFDYATTGVLVPDTGPGDTDDGSKITYFTPTIAGFRAGVSYAASSNDGVGTSNSDTNRSGEGIEVGAQYSNTFGGFSLRAGGGVTFFTDDDDNRPEDTTYGLGAVIGFGGFKVAGLYSTDNASQAISNGTTLRSEYEGFGLSASYETGPWVAAITYGQTLDDVNITDADDIFGITGEVVYNLAPGVRTGVVVEYISDTYETNSAGQILVDADGNSDSEAGFAAGLFLGLTF